MKKPYFCDKENNILCFQSPKNKMKKPYFCDVHCHIDLLKDIDKVIERVRKADVKFIVSNGINVKTNRKTLELSGRYSEVKAALGIYPIEALKMSDEEIDSEIEFIRKNAKKIIAIGEIGIDLKEVLSFGKETKPSISLERQKKNFRKFIRLAMDLGKPVIVHSRKADLETIEVLEEMGAKKVIMHCYFGKLKFVDRIVKNGWFFSIPAIVKKNAAMIELVKRIPVENILCETDSPFLHPDGLKNNEPAFVVESYEKIAELKKLPKGNFCLSKSQNINQDLKIKHLKLDELKNIIVDNCKIIFGSI